MKNKRAFMWDRKNEKLLYVFDIPGNSKKGKFTIAVDVKRKKGPGSKKSVRTNSIISGGITPLSDLGKTTQYQLITGKL